MFKKKTISSVNIWIRAMRPKTLWAGIAPVIIGTALAFGDGKMHLLSAIAALVASLLIQIATNFSNDYFDFIHGADTKERLGPKRVTQSGLVKPEIVKIAFILTFLLAFIVGLYLIWRGGWPILTIGILSIILGILYTGGPFPLGYHGLGDIVVLIFFGPVAVGGTYYVQALEITPIVLIAGLSPGLLSMALLTVNNLRDIHTDRTAGKITLAVRFGELFTRMEYLISIAIACLIPVILFFIKGEHPYALATTFVFIPAIPSIYYIFMKQIGPDLNHILANTGKLLLLYSVVFSISWIL
ncbi:MAG: 1,4-dihydroxy-2-naphthoate polyprenyltransferase [Calditrichia bacterium]|nr:1,4-dihydroxy-2-naphthoate polyprenyltransferase [Calditrichia bacterium]